VSPVRGDELMITFTGHCCVLPSDIDFDFSPSLYSLGYVQVNYVEAFKEYEYELRCFDSSDGSAGAGQQYTQALKNVLTVCDGWQHQTDFTADLD
jgi:hypothetical protein